MLWQTSEIPRFFKWPQNRKSILNKLYMQAYVWLSVIAIYFVEIAEKQPEVRYFTLAFIKVFQISIRPHEPCILIESYVTTNQYTIQRWI